MKIKNFILAMVAMLLVIPSFVVAQENGKFKITSLFRVRSEYRDGYKTLLTEAKDPILVTDQRFRLNFEYENDKIQTRFSVQDVRSWGQTPVIDMGKTATQHPLFVKEAWLKYNFNPNLGLKLGRQVIKYSDLRILSHREWNTNAASHDAAVLQYKKDGTIFDFGLASNATNNWKYNAAEIYAVKNYKHMAFMFYSKKFSDSFTLNFLELAEGLQGAAANTVYVRNTLGPNVVGKFGDLGLNASYYYQMGKKGSDAVDIKASLLTANVSYKLGKTNIKAGYDIYSGKAYDNTDTEYTTFDPIMGGGHKFLGNMDYFAAGIPSGGVTDINIKLDTKVGKTKVAVAFHVLGLAQEMKNGFGVIEKSLGNEIDLSLAKKFGKGMMLQGGYSVMMPTENMEMLKGVGADNSTFANWAWVMVIFKPTFFASK